MGTAFQNVYPFNEGGLIFPSPLFFFSLSLSLSSFSYLLLQARPEGSFIKLLAFSCLLHQRSTYHIRRFIAAGKTSLVTLETGPSHVPSHYSKLSQCQEVPPLIFHSCDSRSHDILENSSTQTRYAVTENIRSTSHDPDSV